MKPLLKPVASSSSSGKVGVGPEEPGRHSPLEPKEPLGGCRGPGDDSRTESRFWRRSVEDTICRHRADRPQGLPPGAEQWRRGSRGSCRHPMTACCEQRGGNNDAGSQGCRRIRRSAAGVVFFFATVKSISARRYCTCTCARADHRQLWELEGGLADLRRQLGLRVCQPASAPHLLFCRNGAEILCLADLTALPRLRGPQP